MRSILVFAGLSSLVVGCTHAPVPQSSNEHFINKREIASTKKSSMRSAPALPAFITRGFYTFDQADCSCNIKSLTSGEVRPDPGCAKEVSFERVKKGPEWDFDGVIFSSDFGNLYFDNEKPFQKETSLKPLNEEFASALTGTEEELKHLDGTSEVQNITSYDNKTNSGKNISTRQIRIAGISVDHFEATSTVQLNKDKEFVLTLKGISKGPDLLTAKQKAQIRKKGTWTEMFLETEKSNPPDPIMDGSYEYNVVCTSAKKAE